MAPETLAAIEEFVKFPATKATKEALLQKLDLATIVQLLGSDAHADLTCRSLIKLVPESTTMLRNDGTALWPVGLEHHNGTVRKTTLDLLSDLSGQEGGMEYLSAQGLLPAILRKICDKELKVANVASSLVLKLVSNGPFCTAFFDAIRPDLESLIANRDDSTSQLRVLELVCKMWFASPACADLCRGTGAKEQLLSLLESEDCLLQLNAVEILAGLPAGEVDAKEMLRLLDTAESLPPGAVAAQLSKSVAHFLAHTPPHIAADELRERLVTILHPTLLTSGPAAAETVPDALSALAILCASPAGLGRLGRDRRLPDVLAAVARHAQSTHHDTRLSALAAAAAALLSSSSSSSSSAHRAQDAAAPVAAAAGADAPVAAAMEESWRPLAAVTLRLAKSPQDEERLAALSFFRGLAEHEWGLRAMFSQADFMPMLTNRKSESSKRALEVKYDTVAAAMRHESMQDIVGPERCDLLRAFLRDGAYYTGPTAAAARLNQAVPIVGLKHL